jgi:hypothetical protein
MIILLSGCEDIVAQSTAIVADHTVMNMVRLDQIPSSYITAAKTNLHIAYGRTSHGNQIIEGMIRLDAFKGSTGLYSVAIDGNPDPGELDLYDNPWFTGWIDYGRDLGSSWTGGVLVDGDFLGWLYTTRKYLGWNYGSGDGTHIADYATGTPAYNGAGCHNCNVIIWAWCGQVSYCQNSDITAYLANMNQLELDYPMVKFVYMTGHTDATGLTGNLHLRNETIRAYCLANNKILYDFEDIESYDPDGNYYGDKHVSMAQNYDYDASGVTEEIAERDMDWWPSIPTGGDANFALDWQAAHIVDVDYYESNIQYYHAQHVEHNMKAYAIWWLFARISGWGGQ